MKMKRIHVPLAWRRIEAGSVLRWPSGTLRVVRHFSGKGAQQRRDWRRAWCYFYIKHCSWTHRGYTLYNVAEMVSMGVSVARIRPVPLTGALHKKIMEDILVYRACKPKVTCCMVRGLP